MGGSSGAGKLVVAPELANPTIVVITDRNDLDDQLFRTFVVCQDLLRQARSMPATAATSASCRRSRRAARAVYGEPTAAKEVLIVNGDRVPGRSTVLLLRQPIGY